MGDSGDVDDIWAEMQKENEAKLAANRKHSSQIVSKPSLATTSTKKGSLAKPFDISSLQREGGGGPKKSGKVGTKTLDASLKWMERYAAPLKLQAEVSFALDLETTDAFAPAPVEAPATLVDEFEELPSATPKTFLAYLQRDINCLSEENLSVRQQSLMKLKRLLVEKIDSLPTDVVDAVADALLKPVLKRMKDKSEKCRELAVEILRSLVENTSDLFPMLPYIFPTLVARLGCEDLDGVAHLPEVMRPDPEQKPVELARPVEESEEVRLALANFVAALLKRLNPTQIYSYIDEATGLIRAQAMDPYHEVKALACETMIAFCYNHCEMLLHFAEPLGRSLMSCLTHNHSRIRIYGLRALTAVFWCGVWKHNHEIVQQLMAFQDPNKAPIKAFYEPMTNINYMSTLSFDRHPAVRRFWFETLAYWLLRVPDKVDHEPYIFPYLLAGLCDDNEDIALEVFWLIERCGELYEEEKEEDLRKTKQYGFDYGWTYGGRGFIPFPLQGIWGGGNEVEHFRRAAAQGPDIMGERSLKEHEKRDHLEVYGEHVDLGERVELPERDYAWRELRTLGVYRKLPRPRLGSRCWVRTHTRRYIKATFNDVVDFRECTALNAGRLLCMSLAYTEEGVTEWLQPMVQALLKFYAGRAWAAGDAKVAATYNCVCKLLGAFLDPITYWQQLKDMLDGDAPLDLDQRIAGVRVLALCVEGSVEVLQSIQPPDPNLGMGRLSSVVPELISTLYSSDLLLSPTEELRAVLWKLLRSFLGPLRGDLTDVQVSQLLFVAVALSAKAPEDVFGETAAASSQAAATTTGSLEEEELLDVEQLDEVLAILGRDLEDGPKRQELVDAKRNEEAKAKASAAAKAKAKAAKAKKAAKSKKMAAFSLDDLDDSDDEEEFEESDEEEDEDEEEAEQQQQQAEGGVIVEVVTSAPASSSNARQQTNNTNIIDDDDDNEDALDPPASADAATVRRWKLFRRALPDVLAQAEGSFQVFRSAIYLAPLELLLQQAHSSGPLLERLRAFTGRSANVSTRLAAQTLAMHLALRCARLLQSTQGAHKGAARLLANIFQLLGAAQLEASESPKSLSYKVVVSGLSLWRRFLVQPEVDPRWVLFPAEESSKSLEWLTSLVADQELYKRYHLALEHAETSVSGQEKENFVIKKTREIREQSEQRAAISRTLAASVLLVGLHRLQADGRPVPWRPDSEPGSFAALFAGAQSLFRAATPKLEPPFVKPTPAYLKLYAAELLRVLLHISAPPASSEQPFALQDDAAKAIHHMSAPRSQPKLPATFEAASQREALATDFVVTLVDLNLTLPPDPNAKHAPATLDGAATGDIVLGVVEEDLLEPSSSQASKRASSAVPSEVSRLLQQGEECLSWNAALALYMLALDLATLCEDGFQAAVAKWRRRKEQAKVLIAVDLLERSKRVLAAARG